MIPSKTMSSQFRANIAGYSTSVKFAYCNLAPRINLHCTKPSKCSTTRIFAQQQLVADVVIPTQPEPSTSEPSTSPQSSLLHRHPCSTPCASGDSRCLQIEALLQNVLKFPRMPPRVYDKFLQGAITNDVESIENLLVNLEALLGRELTLFMVRRQPYLLNESFDAVKARHDEVQRWLALKPIDMIMLLKKNPSFLVYDSEYFKNNLNQLKRILPYTPEQYHTLIKKYPVVLNWRPEVIKKKLDYLRSLCSTREEWQENLEYISPSLLAFYLRDSSDLTRRLEYLVLTGYWPKCQLRDVWKPSNNLYARKLRGYRRWRKQVDAENRARLRTQPSPQSQQQLQQQQFQQQHMYL